LANIAGLVVTAAYLPSGKETDAWLAFGARQLMDETNLQFLQDGGNFESSTCYHQLSFEMVVYATAFILGLGEERLSDLAKNNLRPLPFPVSMFPRFKMAGGTVEKGRGIFPGWYWERLSKMANFTADIAKPDGRAPQIGDNDSGRFFKFSPALNLGAAGCEENHLDYSSVSEAVGGIISGENKGGVCRAIVRAICGGATLVDAAPNSADIVLSSDCSEILRRLDGLPEENKNRLVITASPASLAGLTLRAYPDFGLYIYKNAGFYLAVRCGDLAHAGHAHNDQLSMELWMDGKSVMEDPGAYIYTPLPEKRNLYRSVKAHSSPKLFDLQEPNGIGGGLFAMRKESSCKCLHFDRDYFLGECRFRGEALYRLIRFLENGLEVRDYSAKSPINKQPDNHPPLSFSYGSILPY
jgi:hypothetical protein